MLARNIAGLRGGPWQAKQPIHESHYNKCRGPDRRYFETKLYKKYVENLPELMRFHRITDYNEIKTEIILPGGSRDELGTGRAWTEKARELFYFAKTSTGLYRSCAALLDISNPLKDLLEFGLIGFSLLWLVLAWFGWF